jgi:hypothetical protein
MATDDFMTQLGNRPFQIPVISQWCERQIIVSAYNLMIYNRMHKHHPMPCLRVCITTTLCYRDNPQLGKISLSLHCSNLLYACTWNPIYMYVCMDVLESSLYERMYACARVCMYVCMHVVCMKSSSLCARMHGCMESILFVLKD